MMKYYKLSFTEYNGEHQYVFQYLIEAADVVHADRIADEFLRHWYGDQNIYFTQNADYEFFGGSITVRLDSIVETTKEQFAQDLVNRFTI